MLKRLLIATGALALVGADAMPAPVTVRIVLTHLRSSAGEVRLCVWHEAAAFPDCEKGKNVRSLSAAASPTVTVELKDLQPGTYAVSAIHDENDNRVLDKGRFGLPTEGVGFSRNPAIVFGPPSFKAARFAAEADTTATIQMKYFLAKA